MFIEAGRREATVNHFTGELSRTYMPRASKYQAPASHVEKSVAEVLALSSRKALEPKQLNLLERGADRSGRVTLHCAGNLNLLKERCVAVIGARKASEIGRRRARQFARQLAEQGVVVVSGLAEGIDTEALEGAIDAGGSVVGVIGTPLGKAYPAKNTGLQEAIYRDHLLISQFPAGSQVFPSNFPARNRVMAALSDASVVMEASDTSGTLHQAAECQRLGRWLGIAQSVAEDKALTWPRKFLGHPRTVVLTSTEQFLASIAER